MYWVSQEIKPKVAKLLKSEILVFPASLIWNFYSSLTLNNRKLISDVLETFTLPSMSNMTHLFILFGMRDKMACFKLCILPEAVFYFSSAF